MTILQIGSNDGIDHVSEFTAQHVDMIDKIILVDANPDCVEKTKDQYRKYPQANVVQYAITVEDQNDETHIALYLPRNNQHNAHASLSETHVRQHGHENPNIINVPALSFRQLCDKLSLTKIDRLYIDVEGLDVDIINSIDFNAIQIPYVVFEYIHSDGTLSWGGVKLDDCLRRLTSFGYNIDKVEYNIIATKSK